MSRADNFRASLEAAVAAAANLRDPARLERLDELAGEIRRLRSVRKTVRLHFICTHNSRRSQLGQAWALATARHVGVPDVETFSGGTETTAFDPRAVAALRRAGWKLDPAAPPAASDNALYLAHTDAEYSPVPMFSKRIDHPRNPRSDFVAVMTCAAADEACPVIDGASLRVSLPYDDPKLADGSPTEAETYDARSRQIAAEMAYVFGRVARSS